MPIGPTPQSHVALLAHVSRLGVVIQRIFWDRCTHLQLMQFVSSVGWRQLMHDISPPENGSGDPVTGWRV